MDTVVQPDKLDMTEAEWQARCNLAALYRITDKFGWTDTIDTHMTVRIPGEPKCFLINNYGDLFDEITASSLVKIDLEGNKVIDTPLPVNPAGFLIHSTIHAVRDDAKCVLHTHTLAGVAVSAQKEGLLAISQHSIFPLSSLAYHNYEGVALNDAERPRLVADLGDKMFLILRNHGLLTVGSSVAEAFLAMYFLEASCRIQTMAQAGGSELIPVPAPIVAGAQAMAKQATKGLGADLAWPALLRRLDRLDPSYRT